MHNTVTVMGNLIDDPELTKTRNGNYVAKMRVACSRRVQRPVDSADVSQAQQNLANAGYNAEGSSAAASSSGVEWVDTDHFFIDVECWGQLAKNVRRSLIKGRPIMANGYMYTSSWEDQDGKKRSRPILRASNVGLELSWFVAGSKRSTPDEEVKVDGVEVEANTNDESLVDKDLGETAQVEDTEADAAAAAESAESAEQTEHKQAEAPSESVKKQRVKTGPMPF